MRIELKTALFPQPKSKIKAGDGKTDGKYKFFTSSPIQSKFVDEAIYDKPALIFGTGGNASVHYCDEPFSTSTDCLVMYGRSQIELETIYNYLKSNIGILENGFKGAGLKHISKDYILAIEIDLPSEEIQLEFLRKNRIIDGLIGAKQEQLNLSEELVKPRFIEMFGDPVKNSNGWKTILLKKATSKIGSGATPKGGKESYQDEGVTLIRSMNVHDGRFEYKDLAHITDEQARQLDNVTIEENDVFINITGASVARSCIVPKHILPARVNQHVAIIRCIASMLNPVFANNMFLNNSFKGQLLDIGESGGATRQAITKQQLETLAVILPPIELQEQFAAFVEQTDKSKYYCVLTLKSLKNYSQR